MSNLLRSYALRRLVKPAAVVAVLTLVAINALMPSSSGARPGGPASTGELDAWFDDQMRDAGIPGAAMVVVRDGRVVDTHAFGVADDEGRAITPSTPFVIGSLTKSITALAVVQLVQSGRLALDDRVADVLPDFRLADAAASRSITIRQLLDQTSGLSTATGQRPLGSPVTTLEDRVEELAGVTPVSAPGVAFHYSNANYLVLGRVVEVASGESYADYVRTHIFGPLGMDATSTDAATAHADGLTRAHRLWFGQAPSNNPLFRDDMVPAGFVAASPHDMGRYLLAQLGDAPDVASASALDVMHTGIAPTGLPDQRYGFGWFDGRLGGERVVSHTGSTTDMASMAVLVPSQRLGVVILMNATSTLYETLHKPDTIGLAATALLLGQDPPGTIQMLYPGFVAVSAVVLAIIAIGLVRLVRAPSATAHAPATSSRWRSALLAYRAYVDVVVPAAIILFVPGSFGTDWSVMARIDLGQVLLAIAALRVLDGAIRVGRWLPVSVPAAGKGRALTSA
jgi:CubicO group peptidase (beta-lactamase class C family)